MVVLACQDDYKSLPEKSFAVIKWAREHGYDYLLKLDDDVYCRPERLVVPGTDYTGHAYGHRLYCSGAAYWLSARAMDAILGKWYRRSNAEDSCVGETLRFHHIHLTEDPRYRVGWRSHPKDGPENEFPHPDNDAITFHMWWPRYMPELHANWDKRKQVVDFHNFYGLTEELRKKNPWG